MTASIKSISVEGEFGNTNLMRSKNHAPIYHLRAIVDRKTPMAPTVAWTDDVVEI